MSDWSAYTTYSGGDNGSGYAQPGTVAYEGIGRDQDSSTQFMRSIQNLLGKTGAEATAAGQARVAEGDKTMDPVLDYFRSLMSGDRTKLEGALSPEIDAISEQFGQIRKTMSASGGRGGGKTAALAQLPTQQTGAISNLIGQARKGAAQGLGTIASQQQQQGLALQQLGLAGQEGASGAVLNQRQQSAGETARNMNFGLGVAGAAEQAIGTGAALKYLF